MSKLGERIKGVNSIRLSRLPDGSIFYCDFYTVEGHNNFTINHPEGVKNLIFEHNNKITTLTDWRTDRNKNYTNIDLGSWDNICKADFLFSDKHPEMEAIGLVIKCDRINKKRK